LPNTRIRIRFLLSRDRRITSAEHRVVVAAPNLPVEFELLTQLADRTIQDVDTLVLRSQPLSTKEEAERVGQRSLVTLLIAATRLRLGIDLGKGPPTSGWTEAGLQLLRRQSGIDDGTSIVNEQFGLMLIDDSDATVYAGIPSMRAIIGTPADRFVEALIDAYALVPLLGSRHVLALELFSASKFEASLRARFLTLVSAIECIAERLPRSASAIDLVRSWQAEVRGSALDPIDKQSLASGVRDLERQSIGRSCKTLIERVSGADAAQLFGRCYSARSDLVHSGRTEFDLPTFTSQLENIVADVILGSVGTTPVESEGAT
jgi:hypothetical protein